MISWRSVPLWTLASEVRTVVDPAFFGREVFHYSIPELEATGDGKIEDTEDIRSAKLYLHGDEVLISKLNPRKSRVVNTRPSGRPIVCSTEFVALRPQAVDRRFLYYLLSAEATRQALDARVQSVTRSHQRVNPEDIMRLVVSVPEIEEQRRIADFLDAETSRIDSVVRLRRLQLSAISDGHMSAIQAVFSGSASGAETRIKFLLAQRPTYGVLVPEFVENGVPFIRVQDLGFLWQQEKLDLPRIPKALSSQYRRTILREGDVLVSVVGTLGRAAVVPRWIEGANVNRAIACLRLAPAVDRHLLVAWVGTQQFEVQALNATASDSAQRTLGMADLSNFAVRWPRDVQEQCRMSAEVARIERACKELQAAVERQNGLLLERRHALITAAVTGQVDVTTARGVDV